MAAWGGMVPAQVTHWVFGRAGSCLGQKGASGAEGKLIWSQFCTSRCCAATRASSCQTVKPLFGRCAGP
eukprot:3873350-Prymnesium_polylepis.1